MKTIKFLSAGVATAALMAATTSYALQINQSVSGKGAGNFLSQLDERTDGTIRIMHANSKTEFDTMFFESFLNQTANIEQKLDVLIAEMRKNNELLQRRLSKG
jgi:hypothetical protein